MTRRHVALAALLTAAALAVPSPAQAKQITAMTACGAGGCRSVDRAVGQALHDLGGAALPGTPAAAPHFRLVMHIGDGRRTFGIDRSVYIPSSRALGGNGGWTRLNGKVAVILQHAVAGRTPLRAAALAKSVAQVSPPATSPQPEVPAPPVTTNTRASSGGAVAWWVFGAAGLVLVGALAFIGNSQVRRG
jgi:hypothetical protein